MTTPLKAPELLLPAGSLDKMRAAYDYGADAVYAGQPRYSLRARNNEFRLEQLQQGIAEAHARGKKLFVTSNLLPHNDKVRTYMRDIEPVIALQPDALIMADPGLIMMVREKWPEMPIHLSVQANTVNYAAVKFWQKAGRGAHHPLARTQPGRDRAHPPGMPRHGAGGVRARRAVHCLTAAAACSAATSTGAIPTRAPAPTPAAGTTPRTTPTSTANTGEAIGTKHGPGFQLRTEARARPRSPLPPPAANRRPPAMASAIRWPTRST